MSDDNNTGADTATSDTSDTGQQQHNGGEMARPFAPITTQQALDDMIRDRVRRAEAKGFSAAEAQYKPGHDRATALDQELASEAEKQVTAAREEERAKARDEFTPRLVKQAFRVEAKGVLDPAALDALLEDLNLASYATNDGDVDTDKVAKKIAALAPRRDEREFPDLGAGQRGGTAKTNSMSAFIRQRAGVTAT